jgi:voltage-gated potassium channel
VAASITPLSIYLRRLVLAAVFVLALFAISSGGYYAWGVHFGEPASVVDCIYFTLITLTTIGYGEVLSYAHRPEVRIFSMFVIVLGIGSFLYLISAATSFIFDGQLRSYLQRKRMDREIAKLSGHIIVCGAGQTGFYACEELKKTRYDVVAIDWNPERIKRLSETFDNVLSLHGDATEDAILEEAGIRRARGLLAALTDDKDNLFCVVTARTLNPEIRVVTRAIDQKAGEKLSKAGADRVVSTHFIGAMRMVSEMVRPQVVQFLDFMLQSRDHITRIEEVRVGENCPLHKHTLKEAELRRYGDILVLAAYQPGTQIYRHNPGPDFVLEAGMVLVVLASVDAVQQLRQIFELKGSGKWPVAS